MRKKGKIITPGRCIVYGILGVLFVGWAIIGYLSDKEYSIATLTSKTGYVFDMRAPYFYEAAQLVYCQIRKDNEIIFSRMIGTAYVATNKLKFSLVENEDGVVAITEQTKPHNVIVIFDLNNHRGFPSDLKYEEERRIGKQLVQRLNMSMQEEPFVLGGGVLGRHFRYRPEEKEQEQD
jgi:hypothetical protein